MLRKSVLLFLLLATFLIIGLLPAQAQDPAGDLLNRINSLRGSLGLPGYSWNGTLSIAAQNQAAWMAATGQISHTQSDGSTPTSRAAAAGYASSAVSENIYMGTNATAASAWEWWMNSPIHYRGITNAAYSEVGIGVSTGTNGSAFVLVFGNPAGWQPVPREASSNNGNSPAAPPSFIVGVDNMGNIMHEVQPGQTLGDIALIYGYTWDDLDYIRILNNLSEEQGRTLSIGAVLLVPPWDGTFTPTPGAPPDSLATEPAASTDSVQSIAAVSTDIPTPMLPTPTDIVFVATSAVPLESVIPTSPPAQVVSGNPSWIAATVTPTVAAAALAGSPQPGEVLPTPTIIYVEREGGGTSPLLIVAIVLQVVLLGGAGFEMWRRGRAS